jgi:hypothetical protein
MQINNRQGLSKAIHLISLALFALLLCLNLNRHIAEIKYNNYVDLRNRVVGTRLMAEGISPYYFKWNPSFPKTLLDPADRCNIKNNMITSPPGMLFIMEPLGKLDFADICYWWVAIQYVFFLLIFLFVYACFNNHWSRVFITIAAIFLLFSDNWNDSVFRGQSHFIFPAVLASIFFLSTRKFSDRYFYTGLLFAFLVWIRPNALVIVPFLFLCRDIKRTQLFAGLAVGALFFAGLTIILNQTHYWLDFYNSCKDWVKNNTSGMGYVRCSWPGTDWEKKLVPHKPLRWTSEIGDIYFMARSMHIDIKPFFLFGAFILAYLGALWVSIKKPATNLIDAILIGILLYWFGEITTPVLKMSYYYVELFVVVLYFAGKFKDMRLAERMLLIASFLFIFLDFLPMNLVIGEFCLVTCLIVYLVRIKRQGLEKSFVGKSLSG